MHRSYPATALFRKVLQLVWHQVNTSGEVFAVGQLMPDGTAKGGTERAGRWSWPSTGASRCTSSIRTAPPGSAGASASGCRAIRPPSPASASRALARASSRRPGAAVRSLFER